MVAARPRILIVTRNLPPLVGGMERLNWHMAEELAKVAEVRVVGPEGAASLAPAGVAIVEAPLKPLWKFLWRARALARREARAWRPNVILAGSGLTAPAVRSAARVCGAHTAAYVHGLDIVVDSAVYRALWLPAIRRMERVIANSRATAALCRGIGIDPARIGIVHPGVDMPAAPPFTRDRGTAVVNDIEHLSQRERGAAGVNDFKPLSPRERGRGEGLDSRGATTEPFRQRHNLSNRPLLLSVGRLSARKGLREFVTNALPRIAAAHPGVALLIIGDAPKDALHAEAQTPESIRAAAAQAGVADNVRFLGKVSDPELNAAFGNADVHVFPVRDIPGDPEGFGMVAVEAAAHGLPTVAFAAGGVPDAVLEGETGSLVPPGDYLAFAASVNAWLARSDRAEVAERCVAGAEQFDWRHFGEKLQALLGLPNPHE